MGKMVHNMYKAVVFEDDEGNLLNIAVTGNDTFLIAIKSEKQSWALVPYIIIDRAEIFDLIARVENKRHV